MEKLMCFCKGQTGTETVQIIMDGKDRVTFVACE